MTLFLPFSEKISRNHSVDNVCSARIYELEYHLKREIGNILRSFFTSLAEKRTCNF